MNGVLQTVVLVTFPHGGQRRARANALTALRTVRVAAAEQADAARAFEPARRPASGE